MAIKFKASSFSGYPSLPFPEIPRQISLLEYLRPGPDFDQKGGRKLTGILNSHTLGDFIDGIAHQQMMSGSAHFLLPDFFGDAMAKVGHEFAMQRPGRQRHMIGDFLDG